MARTQTATSTAPAPQFLKPPPKGHHHHSYSATLSVDKIPSIPGFKTSATFLSSLGANLRISEDDLLPSPISTPPSLRASAELNLTLPPPSPLARATMADDLVEQKSADDEKKDSPTTPADPLSNVPELTTYTATDDDDKIAGLKLIADSIAQQRQTASRILISHPLNVAIFGVIMAVIAQFMYKTPQDLFLIFTTLGGICMCGLVAVRYLTRGYIFAAEGLKWSWLEDTDTMIVTKFGSDIIAVLVLGWEKGEKGTRRKKSGRGLIKAWTTKLRYRHKGVGRALLEEAVELVNQWGGDGIVFAEEHANSVRVLKPDFYNAAFDKKEQKASDMLEDVVSERANFAGKKR